MRRLAREAGFTILEALVTAGLCALLGAIAFPSLSSAVNAHRLTAGLRETVSTIRVARSTAVNRNQQARVVLANDGNTLDVEVSPDGVTWTSIGQPCVLADGVKVSAVSPTNGLRFASNGTLATTVTVTVRSARGDTRQVGVSVLGSVDLS